MEKRNLPEKAAILDCGGQYTKVIDRKVRELGVYTEIFPMGVEAKKLTDFKALILSGGPSSVWKNGAPSYDSGIFELGVPVLGICYGMQLICDCFGGEVIPAYKTEYGQIEIDVDPECPLFCGLSKRERVLMSHGDAVKKCPDGFKVCANTGDVTAAIWNGEKKIAGVQFHPEVEPTVNGIKILENFLRGICALKEVYAPEDRIEASVKMIRERVGDSKVIVLVSGGVDSAVTAALLVKALKPEQVYAIHIDHGLMRKNESDIICDNLSALGLTQMERINAADAFFNTPLVIDGEKYAPLSETIEPEKKRDIIGYMFFDVTEKAAKRLNLDFDTAFLAQGTLRPDLIESGNPDVSGYAHKIKTHHNDVGIIRTLRDKGHVIETNWDWHKDEVRKVARMLGLDEKIASRQPFPGPGLGVRIICADGKMKIDGEKEVALRKFTERENNSFFAEIAPMNSVGVQGDNRSYKNLCIISYKKDSGDTFNIDDVMTLAREIPNKNTFINRVALRIDNEENTTEKAKASPLYICHESAELLREIDSIVTDSIMNPKIAQCFAVLLPITHHSGKKYSVAVRAVVTSDFMTARPAVPGADFPAEALKSACEKIKARFGDKISMVLYDVTGKPPATVEWE